jgi:hypothetical protein
VKAASKVAKYFLDGFKYDNEREKAMFLSSLVMTFIVALRFSKAPFVLFYFFTLGSYLASVPIFYYIFNWFNIGSTEEK